MSNLSVNDIKRMSAIDVLIVWEPVLSHPLVLGISSTCIPKLLFIMQYSKEFTACIHGSCINIHEYYPEGECNISCAIPTENKHVKVISRLFSFLYGNVMKLFGGINIK